MKVVAVAATGAVGAGVLLIAPPEPAPGSPAAPRSPAAQAALPGSPTGASSSGCGLFSPPPGGDLAALASSTFAAWPSSAEATVVDEHEALARRLHGRQLAEWLALEDDARAALVEADELAELGPWLDAPTVERLLGMARDDLDAGRRRAAFVALSRPTPEEAPRRAERLVDAFAARPDEPARLGVLEALLTLRRAGAPVDDALGRVLDAERFGAPSAAARAMLDSGDPRAARPW